MWADKNVEGQDIMHSCTDNRPVVPPVECRAECCRGAALSVAGSCFTNQCFLPVLLQSPSGQSSYSLRLASPLTVSVWPNLLQSPSGQSSYSLRLASPLTVSVKSKGDGY